MTSLTGLEHCSTLTSGCVASSRRSAEDKASSKSARARPIMRMEPIHGWVRGSDMLFGRFYDCRGHTTGLLRSRESYPRQLSQCAEGRLCRIEAEAEVFLGIAFVLVRRLMMIRIGTSDDSGNPFIFAHAHGSG